MKKINIQTQLSVFESNIQNCQKKFNHLMNQAIEIRKKAYAPYSKFRVGAAILLRQR